MKTHDIGSHFWYRIKVISTTPLVHRTWTRQGIWPYQTATPLVIRYSPWSALVIGKWESADPSKTESEKLLYAIDGRTSGELTTDLLVEDEDAQGPAFRP